MSNSTLYVGVDPSLTSTGCVALDASGDIVLCQTIGYSLAKNASKLDEMSRIEQIAIGVAGSLADVAYGWDLENIYTAIEWSSYGNNNGKNVERDALYYRILYYLHDYVDGGEDQTTFCVAPTTLKKFATSNGRASKADMRSTVPISVLERFESDHSKTDDLVDAYHLAQLAKSVVRDESGSIESAGGERYNYGMGTLA